MHPTIQFEIARSRAADMQRRAERDRVARACRLARRTSRPARRLAGPRTLALRLLRPS